MGTKGTYAIKDLPYLCTDTSDGQRRRARLFQHPQKIKMFIHECMCLHKRYGSN